MGIDCGLYRITNTLNGRFYIGSSNRLKRRGAEHFAELRNNIHGNRFLQNDYNKCGEECFVFEVIAITMQEEHLLSEEQLLLDEYWDNCKMCYNICPIAGKPPTLTGENHPMFGKSHSEEARKKIAEANRNPSDAKRRRMSEIMKGNKRSLGFKHAGETCKKISEARMGKRHTNEARRKMSEVKKNQSEETRRKISEAHKGRPSWNKGRKISEEHKRRIGESNRGKSSSRKGIKRSEETKRRISEAQRARRAQEALTDTKMCEPNNGA